jgi:hypothetical protein
MGDVQAQSAGVKRASVIVAFPGVASRPCRPSLGPDEPRGEILLFTGVRYERLEPNPGPSRPFRSNGHFPPGGRRRRF